MRVWEVPALDWLSGGLGLVPLAPLGQVRQAELPAVVAQMKDRIDREAPGRARELWSAAYLLMGVRYQEAFLETLLQGGIHMEESVTYQAILRKGLAQGEAQGKTEEARRILLLLGSNRFGEPTATVVAALDALTDLRQLEELSLRLLQASSWEDLLGASGSARRGRARKKTQ